MVASRLSKGTEIREGLWVVAMASIGMLLLLLLHQSGQVMAEFEKSGSKSIPVSFWIVSIVYLSASFSIFPLLRSSSPPEFRITAYVLTGAAPIVAWLLIGYNLVRLGS